MNISPSNEWFWSEPSEELFERLGCTASGLSTAEAESRLARFGPNTTAPATHHRIGGKITRRLTEPLVAILFVAAAIAGFTGDLGSFSIIVVVILLSIILDVVQEYRAEVAADALKRSVAVQADVRRDGVVTPVPVDCVVPGDIVELRAGDLVPADGIVLGSHTAHVNEALMTGEPYPVEKYPGKCEGGTPAEAFNALFAGTAVISGEATMLVVATGPSTRFGGIAASLASRQAPTAFEQGIHRLGLLILRLTIFLTLFVLLMNNVVFHRPILESFLFAVALAVGLTPELLPMVMTVTLSRGALRMAAKRVIVKKLAAIHDLGAMDVLCTDKTGTLTEARVALLKAVDSRGVVSERVLTFAGLNSRFSAGIHSPLDDAILESSARLPFDGWTKVDEVPFDFERRRVSVLAAKDNERILIVKGAPQEVTVLAGFVDMGKGAMAPLDSSIRAALDDLEGAEATQGNRLLAVAWKRMDAGHTELRPEDERDLVLAGFCVFVDPPKESAAAAIAGLAKAGVRVKILSGDSGLVVRHLVDVLGIPAQGLMTGAQMAELDAAALTGRVQDVDLFARLSPDQKTQVVNALRRRGATVGFMGDGVNDAPAIHAAHVGLSVEGATDVARAAADMILLERDLNILVDGIAEGRRTFTNILKYVRMGTSSNFGNMLSMAVASIFLPFLPLTPIQILLNNLIYDFSEIGIPFDRVDPEDLARPHAWNMGSILRFTLVMGTLSSVFDMITFAALLLWFHAGPELFRTAWFLESIITQILVIFVIRTTKPMWRSRAHPVLAASSLLALAAAIVVVLSPIGSALGFVPLPAMLLVAICGIAMTYLVLVEVAKRIA